MNAIARQIQIDIITDQPNEIVTWFNDLWSRINIIETDVYHTNGGDFIYYTIVDDVKKTIFFQDDKNERFWCQHDHYWSILESKFDLKYNDKQSVTKLLVENALNNNVSTPMKSQNSNLQRVENALNNNVSTPENTPVFIGTSVENALNNNVSTPLQNALKDCGNALNNML